MGLSVAACTRMSSGRWVRCLVLLSRSSREALIRASLEFPVCWLHHARRDARAQRATRNTHHAYTYMWCVMSQSNGCGAAACQRVLLDCTSAIHKTLSYVGMWYLIHMLASGEPVRSIISTVRCTITPRSLFFAWA